MNNTIDTLTKLGKKIILISTLIGVTKQAKADISVVFSGCGTGTITATVFGTGGGSGLDAIIYDTEGHTSAPSTINGNIITFSEVFGDGHMADKIDIFNTNTLDEIIDQPISCSPLPIELVSFTGTKDKDNHNVITFRTANEINVNHIVLEESHNNTDRQTIHTFDGKGEHGGKYDYVDTQGTDKTTHYRIKTTDNDGKEELSQIITIKGIKQLTNAEIFPNPTAGRCTIDTKDLPQDTDIVIQIANLQGQIIQTFDSNTSNNQINVEINGPEGLYIVTIMNPSTNERISKKITKQ